MATDADPDKKRPKKAKRKQADATKATPAAKVEAPPSPAVRTGKLVKLRIRRQASPTDRKAASFQQFELTAQPGDSIHALLTQIQRRPITASGERVAPVAWEAGCLDESCGACAMLINGQPSHACTTLVEDVAPANEIIQLEPLSKFPVERDLVVDRSRFDKALSTVKAWIPIDGTHAAGDGPAESAENQRARLALARCVGCGACLEACPQLTEDNDFVGAAAINQVRLLNLHPGDDDGRKQRLEALMGPGGIADCGGAQNCVEVCPKEIPLVDSIASINRETTRQLFRWFFR